MRGIKRAVLLLAAFGALLLGPTISSAESICVDAGVTGLLTPAMAEAVEGVHSALRDGGIVIDTACAPIP